MSFATGDRVRLTCDGRTLDATIVLASSNGRSLALTFEGIVAGHVGMMPVLDAAGTGQYVTLLGSRPVTLERM
jgi:hypothetical protein